MSDLTLLVVDDHKPNRDMLSRRLTREGYTVLTAESGMECLETVRKQPISLILLDLMMPGMSGIEVLQELRKDHDMPVLMVSANTDSPQMVAALDHGANDYLTKPVDFDILMAKLRRFLASKPATLVPPPKNPSVKAETIKIGHKLAHYQLVKLLGEGGMGRVYQATDTKLLRDVALKIMIGDMNEETRARFMIEAQAVARVSHPGVVVIYEIGEHPLPYIAMELIDGKPLDDATMGMQVHPGLATDWTIQMLDALQAVHERNIFHRDLKPGNVMLSGGRRVKVMDFGLAKLAESSQKLTQSGHVWGTPQYMSPEHVNPDFGEVDAQSDLFAAGIILYELLTGHPPFRGDNPSRLLFEILTKTPAPPHEENPSVPPELSKVVLKSLEKNKFDRYENAKAFASALRALRLPLPSD